MVNMVNMVNKVNGVYSELMRRFYLTIKKSFSYKINLDEGVGI